MTFTPKITLWFQKCSLRITTLQQMSLAWSKSISNLHSQLKATMKRSAKMTPGSSSKSLDSIAKTMEFGQNESSPITSVQRLTWISSTQLLRNLKGCYKTSMMTRTEAFTALIRNWIYLFTEAALAIFSCSRCCSCLVTSLSRTLSDSKTLSQVSALATRWRNRRTSVL